MTWKYPNKRFAFRSNDGRFRRATGKDLGIGGICPICKHLLMRHYDGDPQDTMIDPFKFRYRCFTCEPIKAQLEGNNGSERSE